MFASDYLDRWVAIGTVAAAAATFLAVIVALGQSWRAGRSAERMRRQMAVWDAANHLTTHSIHDTNGKLVGEPLEYAQTLCRLIDRDLAQPASEMLALFYRLTTTGFARWTPGQQVVEFRRAVRLSVTGYAAWLRAYDGHKVRSRFEDPNLEMLREISGLFAATRLGEAWFPQASEQIDALFEANNDRKRGEEITPP